MLKFKRRKIEVPRIELTPVVDMVFILLIFFLLSSTFLRPVIKMNLPVAAYGSLAQKEAIKVVLTKDKKIYLNGKLVEFARLQQLVKVEIEKSPISEVVFSADKNIEYGLFINAMDAIKLAGAKTISLEHEVKK